MTTGLSPGIYKEEVAPSLRQINPTTTSKICVVGVTERGPIATPTRSTSWEEWVSVFGGYTANSDVPQAVYGAFLNGAREVVTVRVVHFTDITNSSSFTAVKASAALVNAGAGSAAATIYSRKKAPYILANGDTLIVKRDGTAQPTITISATRASKTSSNTETQDMSGGKTLTIDIDSYATQTITFVNGDFGTPASATAEEVAAVINAQIKGARAYDSGGAVVIESDTLGTGSKVQITGGDADTEWDWGTTASNGTGNVSNVDAVTIAELKTLIEASVLGVTVSDDGLSRLKIVHDTAAVASTLQIDSSSTADTKMVLDNDVHAGLASAGTAASKTGTVAGNWALASGDTLAITTDLGGPTSATFTGTRASIESAAETFDMSSDPTLTLQIDDLPAQTISWSSAGDFSVAATATAEEVVEAANQQLRWGRFELSSSGTKVTISSDKGGKSSKVYLQSGTAISKLGFASMMAFGTGNVEDISAVTYEEAKTIIEASVSGVRVTQDSSDYLVISRSDVGSSGTLDIPSGTARTKFGFATGSVSGTTGSPATTVTAYGKYEGTYANSTSGMTIKIEAATSGRSDEFNLKILLSGVLQESWLNLTMGAYSGTTPTDSNYAVDLLNNVNTGSDLFTLTDALITGTATDRRPANGTYSPSGGDDGLTSLDDNDFIGDSAGQNGLRALDTIDDASLLIVPGRATSAVHNAMITYCETTRSGRMFTILDPPTGYSYSQMQTYVVTTASLKNSSEYASIYWPEVKITNPNKTALGNSETITIPPSGHLAGMYVRTDLSQQGGVYLQPAGTEKGRLLGVVDVADSDVNREAVRDVLYPDHINPIVTPTGQPIHADGCANLKRNFNFPSIGERRGVIFIEYSIIESLQWVKFQNLTRELRERVERVIKLFLVNQTQLGAFASKTPSEAFYVDAGEGMNPPSQVRQRKLNVRLGLATAAPAEFINLIVSQDTRALEDELNRALSI